MTALRFWCIPDMYVAVGDDGLMISRRDVNIQKMNPKFQSYVTLKQKQFTLVVHNSVGLQ